MADQSLLFHCKPMNSQFLKTAIAVSSEKYPVDTAYHTVYQLYTAPCSISSIIDFVRVTLNGWDIEQEPTLVIANQEETFYLKLLRMESYVPVFDRFVRSVRLFSIMVPLACRRQGLATRILELVEDFASRMTLPILIGPVMEDAMHKLVTKRGKYVARTMFDYLCLEPLRTSK
jgi:hypothetical protein